MPKHQNSSTEVDNIPNDTTVDGEMGQPRAGNTLAIQNNNYFTQQVDLVALGKLTAKSPELAQLYMDIQREQLEHGKHMDYEIVALEKTEQQARHEDIPFQRKYAMRSQIGAIVIVLCSLCTSVALAVLGMDSASMAAIIVGAGVVAVNFLGIRNRGQK